MWILLALATLYNFIHLHESNGASEEDLDDEDGTGDGAGDDSDIDHDFGLQDGGLCNKIAINMWMDYLTFRQTYNMTYSDNDFGSDYM